MSKLQLNSISSKTVAILLITPFVPRPSVSAGDRRLFAMLETMAPLSQLDLFYLRIDLTRSDKLESDVKATESLGIRVLNDGKADDNGWVLGREMERTLLARRYDFVFFEFWHAAFTRLQFVRWTQPWAKIVTDTVDVHYLREAAGAQFNPKYLDGAQSRAANEKEVYKSSDLVIAVTAEDEAELLTYLPCESVARIPLIIPSIHRAAKATKHPILSFIGGFGHLPNDDAVTWFVTDIFPDIQSQLPDVCLQIIGANAPESIQRLAEKPGVELVGWVADTTPYLEAAAVSVAPLRFGAGMKGKVVEAMAAGLAVVSTSVGAQGLGDVSGRMVVAETPEDFSRAVVTLLREPQTATAIGLAGQKHVATICGPEVVLRQVKRLLESGPLWTPTRQQVLTGLLKAKVRFHAKTVTLCIPLLPCFVRAVRGFFGNKNYAANSEA